jgi:hypothetical protein
MRHNQRLVWQCRVIDAMAGKNEPITSHVMRIPDEIIIRHTTE